MKKVALLTIIAVNTLTIAFGLSHRDHPLVSSRAYYAGKQAAKATSTNAARCVALTYSLYDGTSFVPVDSETYAYSGSRGGSIMGQMRYDNGNTYYNTGSSYLNVRKYAQTFDGHGNILTHTEQMYDFSSSAFINDLKSTYVYDGNDDVLIETNQIWNSSSSAWEYTNRYTYTLTTPHLMQSSLQERWNGSAWENASRDSVTYNSAHNPTTRKNWNWNNATSAWDLADRNLFNYDGSNNETSDLFQNWNASSNTWENYYQDTFAHFTSSNRFQILIHRTWDAGANVFVNGYRDSFIYNSYHEPDYFYEDNWNVAGTGSWTTDSNSTKGHFYYELYTSSVSNCSTNKIDLCVYPNPATDVVKLNFIAMTCGKTFVRITDITGRVVALMSNVEVVAGQNNVTIPLDDIASGTYLVQIMIDGICITQKIAVDR